MEKTTYIYRLLDPQSGEPRYIGKANDPEFRLTQHISRTQKAYATKKQRAPVKQWIHELKQQGHYPGLEILEQCPIEKYRERETYWIAYHLREGHKLVNSQNNAPGLTLYLSDKAWGKVVALAIERGISESEAATLLIEGANNG